MQASIDSRGPLDIEYRIVLPNGETRWIAGPGPRPLPTTGRAALRLLGAAYDTTGPPARDARVSRVLEAMNAAFFSLDRDWRFTYVNAEAERVLARGREELSAVRSGRSSPPRWAATSRSHYRDAVRPARNGSSRRTTRRRWTSWYEVRAWPGPDGLSVYFLDVTERRAAQERARRSAARLALIADISRGHVADARQRARRGGHPPAGRRGRRAAARRLGDPQPHRRGRPDAATSPAGTATQPPATWWPATRSCGSPRSTRRPGHARRSPPVSCSPSTTSAPVVGSTPAAGRGQRRLLGAVAPDGGHPPHGGPRSHARRAEHLPLAGPEPPPTPTTSPRPATSPSGWPWPWTTPGSTSSSAGWPRGCSAACSPRRRSPTTPRSSSATGRPWGGPGRRRLVRRVPPAVGRDDAGDRRRRRARHRGGRRDGPAARHAPRHRLPATGSARRRSSPSSTPPSTACRWAPWRPPRSPGWSRRPRRRRPG